MDMQTGFLEGGAAISDAQSLVSQLEVLLSAARTARALIVQLQNDGLCGAIDEPGQPGWRLHLPPMPDEPVLRKSSDDGFVGTRLDGLLREHGVRRVVIGSPRADR
ncbi:MAG: cysteine hydrolase family protein [Nakamurella sp.]